MKELMNEEYRHIAQQALAVKQSGKDDILVGRAAYAASFPYAVAEALEELTREEIDKLPCPWAENSWANINIRDAFRNRLRALTARPDPAVEAVKAWITSEKRPGNDMEFAALIVAAVRSADGAK